MDDVAGAIERYCDGVLAGSVIACRHVRNAVLRYRDDLAHGDARGLWFDAEAAQRAVGFIESCLVHTSGEYAGEPFLLRQWQRFIVWNLFGWMCRGADGGVRRRFRKAYISLGRGNGKTPLGAAIINYLAWADSPPVPRAQCYCFATKEEQAKIAWTEAKCQIESSTSRSLRRQVQRLTKNMHHLATGAKLEPKGSDSDGSDGWIVHGALLDELHAWRSWHRGLKEKIETAMKGAQPMEVIITTAGDETSDIWIEEHEWAVQVVTPDSGIQDDSLFVYIAEVDRDAPCKSCSGKGCEACGRSGVVAVDPLDESVWPQANPMLAEPRSPIKLDQLRTLAHKAAHRPEVRAAFCRYHANQMTTSFSKLITPELWSRGSRPVRIASGAKCYAGFDWGWRDDLASLVLVSPVGEEYHVLAWAWVPADGRRDLTAPPWSQWVADGWLTVTPGDTTDVDAIYSTMEHIVSEYEIVSLAYDPNNAREFSTRCMNDWGIPTFDFVQTTRKYNEPMRAMLDALREGRLVHGGNPLLAWSAGNLVAKQDAAGYMMPAKQKAKEKIDPIVALIMAFSECKFGEREPEHEADVIVL